MTIGKIHVGSQTYPWEMSSEKYAGEMPHMIRTVADGGYSGIEATPLMLGGYYQTPEALAALLDQNHLAFAALGASFTWLCAQETSDERREADRAIAFAGRFPGALLMIGHHPTDIPRSDGLLERQMYQMRNLDSVAKRAADMGITVAYHPNSAPTSIFRDAADYEILFEELFSRGIGFAPDIGHIMNGGMDAFEVVKRTREHIRHVHFKDMDSCHVWSNMGAGLGQFPQITRFLAQTGYDRWIIVEDESPEAEVDPDGVVLHSGAYMRTLAEEIARQENDKPTRPHGWRMT